MSHDRPSPGPWYTDHEHEYIMVFGADKTAVADCASYYASPYQAVCEANARLIAAAPELLIALKQIIENDDFREHRPAAYAQAVYAIRKAEGQS